MQFYFREEWRVPAGVGALSFSVGVGVGYLISSKRAKTTTYEIEETITVDVQGEVDETISQLAMDFAKAAEEQIAVRQAVDSKDIGEYKEKPEPEPEPKIFPSGSFVDEWNQEEEESERGPDAPYVIHREEFYAGQTGYSQTSLVYFSADDVLCDGNQVPIYNADKVVGRLEFGRGSGDSDTVYIRNESLKSEYEVTRDYGSYQTEVLGIEIEAEAEDEDLKHSSSVRKFRD